MNLTYEGLSLWYGTPDAPAPLDEVTSRSGTALVVGVRPPNPTNVVCVRYRVDGGIVQSAPGRELRTDDAHESQYFAVSFPPFPAGKVVEYCPVMSCAGRQVPALGAAERFPSKFLLPEPAAPPAKAKVSRSSAPIGLRPELQFLATVTVRFDRIEYVGETPEGVRIDFYAVDGTVVGPVLNGRVLAGAADHMFVRPDGVGMIRVRGVIATSDGAKLEVEDTGSIDFGFDGYERARANRLPLRSTFVICPRFLTGHPRYVWLNRVQCLGIGRARLDDLTIEYELFAARARPVATAT